MTWRESVAAAIQRHIQQTGNRDFSRQQLIDQLDQIVSEAQSAGETPEQTLSRVLQELRNDGEIEFVEPGHYRFIG